MMNSRHGLQRNIKTLRATGVQSSSPPILSSPPLIQNPRHPQFRRTLDFRRTNLSSPAPQSRGMDLAGTRRGCHWPPDRHCGECPRREWERIETRGIETRKGSSRLCFRSARGGAGVAMEMRPIRPVAPVGLHALLQLPGGGRRGRLLRGAVACTGGGIRVLHAGTGAGGCWLAVAAATEEREMVVVVRGCWMLLGWACRVGAAAAAVLRSVSVVLSDCSLLSCTRYRLVSFSFVPSWFFKWLYATALQWLR
jgi:hypothetical protein